MKDYIITDDVRKLIPHTNCTHFATIVSGKKTYVAYVDNITNSSYVEQADIHGGDIVLKQIKDDTEWQDVMLFCIQTEVFSIAKNKDFKLGKMEKPILLN